MSFLNPLFLLALIAVGLPLLIHLLNLRKPKKIAFSTLSFFQQLTNTTIKRIRIKKYLLLFMRVAAIICLALVLARPFLPPGLSSGFNSQAPAINAILIDNSISMQRIGNEGPLFEYAKNIIKLIEQASTENDRFILQVSNGAAENGNILSRSNLQKALEELTVQPAGNFTSQRLNGLVEQVKDLPYENKKLFIISDGQKSQFAGLQNTDRETLVFTFIDVGNVAVQNTVIRNVSTSTKMIGANIPFTLNVEVVNHGEIPAINQFVTLQFNGEPAGQYSLSLQPNESQTFSFVITPDSSGSSKGLIQIEGDAFQADNNYYFTIQVPQKRDILWIEDDTAPANFISYTGAMLRAAGENDAQLSYTKVKPGEADAATFNAYDAIILDGLRSIPEYLFQDILRYTQNGNGIVFFPNHDGDLNNYNRFLAQFNAGKFEGIRGEYASFKSIAVADELRFEHPAFSDLFEVEDDEPLRFTTPDIYYYLRLNNSNSATDVDLLLLNNGDPLVREKRFGEGQLLISTIGNNPGWSNFPVQPLFAPFYYRMLLYAAASDEGGFQNHQLGNPFSWTGNIEAEQAVIRTDNDEIVPNVRIVTNGIQINYSAQEWEPGWATIADAQREHLISINLDRAESDFRKTSISEIKTLLNDDNISIVEAGQLDEKRLQDNIISSGFGREIWNWFLLAGLLFLISESLISRLYKTENQT